uniref:Uncharacterized protein n=1 Tax=Nonomuraea gerenzanensis TaxID=93944 RepID=A0A1M4EHZ6_9ACTN|nr:hypothetical protein BN4615_P8093 [Nonomuraea gerenzanensis]
MKPRRVRAEATWRCRPGTASTSAERMSPSAAMTPGSTPSPARDTGSDPGITPAFHPVALGHKPSEGVDRCGSRTTH